jgi:type I restriction enzyme, S subunit
MSSDIETTELAELCEQVIDCPHSTPVWMDAGVIVLRSSNIRNGRLDLSNPSYTDEFHYQERSRRATVRAGDLVITREAPMGEVCLIPENLKCCLGQRMVMLRPDQERCDGKYLLYALQSQKVQNEIRSHEGTGSTVSNLRIPVLKSLPIPTPDLANQKAIAHILGTLDDKIELNRKTNETLEAMAKALFKSWFVDFDPVRAKAEGRPTGLPAEISDLFTDSFEDSELGEIPRGWEPRTIREWGRTECGKTPSTHNQEFYGNNYMFVTIPDLHNGFHIVTSGKQLSELGADSQRKKLLPPGSVMVSCIATPGLVGVTKEACFTNQQINSIIPNSKEASWFLALAMIENRDLLLSLGGGGSVFFNLSKGRFDEIEILAPSEDLISAFSGVVSALMDRCFATKLEIIAFTNVRDALLPKLISGELRIPDAEKMLEEVGV